MDYAIITVRSASTRLPRKCFLKFGDKSVLEHVIKRTKTLNLIPIVCTTKNHEDDEIENLAKDSGAKIYRGPSKNKLLRWYNCCVENNIDYFHTVDADDPFFCGEEVFRSLKLLVDKNLDFVEPTPSSCNGGATVGYSIRRKFLKKVCNDSNWEKDTEMISEYLYKVPSKNYAQLEDPSNSIITQRMTLDYWEDYVLLYSILQILGPYASREEISNLFKQNPSLTKINSFRNSEWKERQEEQSK